MGSRARCANGVSRRSRSAFSWDTCPTAPRQQRRSTPPTNPVSLQTPSRAIESVRTEVRSHLKRVQIDRPDIDPSELAGATSKPRRRGIGERKREKVRFLIPAGVAHAEIVHRTGVSGGTVSTIRQELKGKFQFISTLKGQFACPLRAHPSQM